MRFRASFPEKPYRKTPPEYVAFRPRICRKYEEAGHLASVKRREYLASEKTTKLPRRRC